ncbi:hypothetical protein [Cognatishimia activa]|uniref:Uncharacterized protein n=1 Tax=Cognatishimia activa TaxID=1715691 RepID=A0A0P1IXE4_9RHOB|nr:hypothetical protein [Cognatishimia activa]CUJ17039.1 hypothetical protein TA5113_02519 [Cognatishimia activa]CUK25833.1 hypothetical protein TA5114_01637 [Cognatishimia activa]
MLNKFSSNSEKRVNDALAMLRERTQEGDLSDHVKIAKDIYLNADPNLGLGGRFQSTIGDIVTIDAQTPSNGYWIGLHIKLSSRDFGDAGVIGFASRGHAPEYTIVNPCIRSGTTDGFVDCFFDKHMLLHADSARYVDAVSIEDRDELPAKAPWRELILFLPTKDFQLTLTDLRVFVV